jgi:hypothetical protein
MSYRHPAPPIFLENGSLLIPRFQQRGDTQEFSYQHPQKDQTILSMDNPIDVTKMLLITLKDLAKLMGIPGSSKMNKKQLVTVVSQHLVFE